MIKERAECVAVIVNEKIYSIGGESNKCTLQGMECYDIAKNTWTICANLPSSVQYSYVLQWNPTTLCLLGGYKIDTSIDHSSWYIAYNTTVFFYNIPNNKWEIAKWMLPCQLKSSSSMYVREQHLILCCAVDNQSCWVRKITDDPNETWKYLGPIDDSAPASLTYW